MPKVRTKSGLLYCREKSVHGQLLESELAVLGRHAGRRVSLNESDHFVPTMATSYSLSWMSSHLLGGHETLDWLSSFSCRFRVGLVQRDEEDVRPERVDLGPVHVVTVDGVN